MTRNECKAVRKDVKSSGEGIWDPAAASENNEFSGVGGCFLAPKVCFREENL
jgi:hypothetical protein